MIPLRLFFDECICEELPRKLKELYTEHYPQLEVKHYREDYQAGVKDSEWIPQLRKGDWLVITSDRGVRPHAKLPHICAREKVTSLVITSTLLHLGYAKYKQAILCVWPQITQMPLLPKGTTVLLSLRKYYPKQPWPYLQINKKPFFPWCDDCNIDPIAFFSKTS